MSPADRTKFVNDLVDDIRRDVLRLIETNRIPDDWDGHELRQLLADKFTASAGTIGGSRLKEYRNTVLVNNL